MHALAACSSMEEYNQRKITKTLSLAGYHAVKFLQNIHLLYETFINRYQFMLPHSQVIQGEY